MCARWLAGQTECSAESFPNFVFLFSSLHTYHNSDLCVASSSETLIRQTGSENSEGVNSKDYYELYLLRMYVCQS